MKALDIQNLGKAYRHYGSEWRRILSWFGLPFKPVDEHWVLRGISFSVEPGEAVGIVGQNGAGKSTLLKLITGIIRPTEGVIHINGSISAMIELGLGFNPEFTGRQNAYHSLGLRGFSRKEIEQMMPEVEAFAEIGDYFDQPMRTYSSGMQARVAFSVATANRPDILIVDEVLSVGDAYFQHKSFERIREFGRQGTTLLFVSHSHGVVKTLCDRAILFDEGLLIKDDTPDATLDYYNAIIVKQKEELKIRQVEDTMGHKTTRSGNEKAKIVSVELMSQGKPVRAVRSGDPVVFNVEVSVNAPIEELTIGILIRDKLGNDVFGTNTFHHDHSLYRLLEGCKVFVDFQFPQLLLGVGSYSLTVALHKSHTHLMENYDWWDRAIVFHVVPGQHPNFIGVCNLPVSVTCNCELAENFEAIEAVK